MVYGKYEYLEINPRELVVLPQVRQTKNAKIDELVDSIDDKGLINPIDVAKLTYDEFVKHINFINGLWKKNVQIEDYHPINGFYYVVIAGHTRLLAIKALNKKKKKADLVEVKIHKAKSSEEILAIQLDENIHSETRIEERAIAIIETYRLGIINGKWQDKTEFIKLNQHKFSRRVLSDALVFADLPVEIQEYVFQNNIAFTVGVELGRLYPLIVKYEADFNENKIASETDIKWHYVALIARLQQSKSIKNALTKISAHTKTLNDHFRPKEEVYQETFDWFMSGPDRQYEEHRKEQIASYNAAVGAINSLPFEYFEKFLRLNSDLAGVDHSEELSDIRRLYLNYITKHYEDGDFRRKK